VNLQSNGKDVNLNKANADLKTQTDQNKAYAAEIVAKDKEITKLKEELKAKTAEN
jgi:cell division protein FtsB